jgi:hypothetical protein
MAEKCTEVSSTLFVGILKIPQFVRNFNWPQIEKPFQFESHSIERFIIYWNSVSIVGSPAFKLQQRILPSSGRNHKQVGQQCLGIQCVGLRPIRPNSVRSFLKASESEMSGPVDQVDLQGPLFSVSDNIRCLATAGWSTASSKRREHLLSFRPNRHFLDGPSGRNCLWRHFWNVPV